MRSSQPSCLWKWNCWVVSPLYTSVFPVLEPSYWPRSSPEVCDDGYLNGGNQSNCTTDCTWCTPTPPRCGDGHIDPGEECDDGADNGSISSYCDANCHKCTPPGPPPKPATCPCQTCNPNPFFNKCTITTSCISTPSGNDYCACRAGYRADGLAPNDPNQFRLAFPGQEYRVFVAPGVNCDTFCTSPFPGPQSCQEVPVQGSCWDSCGWHIRSFAEAMTYNPMDVVRFVNFLLIY